MSRPLQWVQNSKVCYLYRPTASTLPLRSQAMATTPELPSTLVSRVAVESYQLSPPLASPITTFPLGITSRAVGSCSSLYLLRQPLFLISCSNTCKSFPMEKKVSPLGWNCERTTAALVWRLMSWMRVSECGSHSLIVSCWSRELLRIRLLKGCQLTELTPYMCLLNSLQAVGTPLFLPMSRTRQRLSPMPTASLAQLGDRLKSMAPSKAVCTLADLMSSMLGPLARSTQANTPFLSATSTNLPSWKQPMPPMPPLSLLQQKSLILGYEQSRKLMSPLSAVFSQPRMTVLLSLRKVMEVSFSLAFLRLWGVEETDWVSKQREGWRLGQRKWQGEWSMYMWASRRRMRCSASFYSWFQRSIICQSIAHCLCKSNVSNVKRYADHSREC